MSVPDPVHFATGTTSDVGRVRKVNQDFAGEFSDPSTGRRLMIVADGMGGHVGGEVASRTAVEAVGKVLETGGEDAADLLRRALETANARIRSAAQADSELAGMGTTGVCLLFEPDGRAWVGHVGDSRAYRLREGRLEQLTQDHSVVGALIRMGHITEEEARSHPQRHEILRAIGTNDAVEVEVAALNVRPGDRYLLCSDGLTNELNEEEIAPVLAREAPGEACRMLVEKANLAGGGDNVTVAIASIPTAPNHSSTERIASRAEAAPRAVPVPLWIWGAGLAFIGILGWLILADR